MPAGILSYLEAIRRPTDSERSWREAFVAWSPHHSFMSLGRNLDALRNPTSWLLALWWVLDARHYNAGCVVSVSFLFSPSLGSLQQRNVNRMIGVDLGLVVGNLPACILLYSGLKGSDGQRSVVFASMPQGLI